MFQLIGLKHSSYKIYIFILCIVLDFTGTSALAENSKKSTRTSFSEVKWKELSGGRAVAQVKGDMTKGAYIKLLKFSAGSKTPPHTHSHSYTGFVVNRHYEPSKPETQTILSAGSFWTIPANVIHISECIFICI